MKKIKNMSQVELAAYVQDSLQEEGIPVVLSGGSAVSFYCSNKKFHRSRRCRKTSLILRAPWIIPKTKTVWFGNLVDDTKFILDDLTIFELPYS